jgi:peptide/nickel transport system permease protein
MLRFVLRRLAGTLAVLFLLSIFTFLLAHAVPGGPLWEQYASFLVNALRLDFGISYQSPSETVTQIIGRTWPVSIQLGMMAAVIAIVAGVSLGLAAAFRQNTWIDYLATLLSTLTITTPSFVVAIGLIYLFSARLHWLPTGGWEGPNTWIMPVVAMALASIGPIARYTRGAVLDVAHSDYVRTARAKGVPERLVATRHVLRNALIPMLTVIVPMIPGMITGTIFIESLFRVPGLGRWFVSSSFSRDYPMILGITMLWAALISVTYVITDVLYVIADPRVRLEERRS